MNRKKKPKNKKKNTAHLTKIKDNSREEKKQKFKLIKTRNGGKHEAWCNYRGETFKKINKQNN